VIEAAECWPTFSSRSVVGLMAGGQAAFLQAQEGAEDDRPGGAAALAERAPTAADFVLGIAASGRTPFVLGVLDGARAAGARAGLLCCAPPAEPDGLDVVVRLETGPEPLTGSTRMKAGTATKCALNAITTGAMARLGKVYGDLMVDVVPSNAKLRVRARRIVATLVGGEEDAAGALLEGAAGAVKVAVVMGRLGLEAPAARERLAAAGGSLRGALGDAAP
jgi:N-acetylmuramic acid 6-phosphate etherase